MYYTPVLNVNTTLKKALFSLLPTRTEDALGHINFRNMLQLAAWDKYAMIQLTEDIHCAFSLHYQERPEGQKTGFMIHYKQTNDIMPIYGRVVFVKSLNDSYVRMTEAAAFTFMSNLKSESSDMFAGSEWVSDTVYLYEKEGVIL